MKRHLRNIRLLAGSLLLLAALYGTPAHGQAIVNIVSPVGTGPLAVGVPVQVAIEVSGPATPIASVELFADGMSAGSATQNGDQWLIDFTPSSLGTVTLRAEATDEENLVFSSDSFDFDVLPPGMAPEVSILFPVDGSRWLPGTSLPVQVTPFDEDGLISRVELRLNGVLVGIVSGSPYQAEIQLPSIGSYTLQAVAVDNQGLSMDSEQITLIAGPQDEETPRVVIDFPLPLGGGDTVNDVSYASATYLNATVKDPDGTDIESVEFFINGQSLGEAEAKVGDAYSLFFDPNALGNYLISVRARDSDGNIGWAVPLSLNVGPLERRLPRADMIQPIRESVLGRVVPLFVEADGGLIPVDRVDFFANGVLIGSVDEPSVGNLYSYNWVPEETGDYEIQTRVVQIDPADSAWDNWKISDAVAISVIEAPSEEMPEVSMVNPVEGEQYTVLNPIALQADAEDPLGSILSVTFYVNGRPIENNEEDETNVNPDTRYPYSYLYVPESPGLYQFVAVMESDRGMRIQSDPVSVRVLKSQLPTVVVSNPLEGSAISVGKTVLVTATTSSTGGENVVVDFYSNGVFIGSDPTFPFNIGWTPQSTGQFALKAVAREAGTLVGFASSPEVNVTVNPTDLPEGSIVEPSDFDPTVGSTVAITVEAADSDGYVESVEFFVNGASIGITDVSPFTNFWSPGNAGQYEISALITDNSKNQVVISRTVSVVTPKGNVPRITMSVTASGNVTPGSRVVVNANAFDDTPDELEVSFFVNGVLTGTDAEAPYSIIVDPNPERQVATGLPVNAYELTALAKDPDGNSSISRLFPLYVSDFAIEHPSIEILNIEADENVTFGSRVPIQVGVKGGAARNVENVVFYVDGVEIGRVPGVEPSGRYTFDWLPDYTGAVEITAAALLTEEFYDHDRDSGSFDPTPRIVVTPVNVAFPVTVDVNEAIGILPSISLDVYPENENLAIGSRTLIYADAQDLDGTVERVEFFLDGVSIGVDTVAPFTQVLTTTRPGNFSINALASDSDGNIVTSTVVNLGVEDRVITQTPSISLTVPDSGQEGNILSLRASTEGFVNGPEAVVFYVNGQEVGQSTDSPYAFPWAANLSGTLTFFASAKHTLADGSRVTTVSEIVESTLVDNLPPVIDSVVFTFPGEDSGDKPNPYTNDTLTFTVTMSDTGAIETAELLRDGDVILVLDNPRSPFDFSDIPPNTGSYEYSVLITDKGALQTQSESVSVTVDERPGGGGGGSGEPVIPEILNFSSDVVGSSSLVNLPITLMVEAVDEEGIDRVEFFQDGALFASVFSVPYEVEFVPMASGNYNFRARVTNVEGNQADSELISITVRQPNPLDQNTDFVYQTFLDLLMRTPTLEERNFYTGRIESGDLSRDRFIRELISPAEGQETKEYSSVRSVLLTWDFLFNQWPSREQLVEDVGMVKDGGLVALVSSVMPAFEAVYIEALGGAVPGVPDILSPESEIEHYIRYLFGQKYGLEPTAAQLKLAKLHFRSNGRDGFTAAFIEDIRIVATSSGYLTLGLGFSFDLSSAPDDGYLRQADAATLLINLLRVTPMEEEVSSLSTKLFAAQVAEVLEDARYAARFQTAFARLEHHTNGWKRSDWFGWFNTSHEPWIFHTEHGWISFKTMGQGDTHFWYYDSMLGWVWTNASLYPVMYEETRGAWLMSIRLVDPVDGWRNFYSFNSGEYFWVKR